MPRVSISGTSKTFEIASEEVIYDALSDRGEELPHGCLSGSCGSCRIEVIEGAENLKAPGAVEQDTLKSLYSDFCKEHGPDVMSTKKIRLSCRAKVLGDVCIKPFK